MIDVKRTIFETIKDRFDKMRFLGDNNPKALKKILSLIVLDDIFDWSAYLDDSQAVQKRLQEMRTNYIMCNKEFLIQYLPMDNYYINVNTPQTGTTWVRVWDHPEVIEVPFVEDVVDPETQPTSFVPNYNCEIEFVYFGGDTDKYKEDPETHKPSIDLNTLNTCEKMNIYINRKTGQEYFLDPDTCLWKKVQVEAGGKITWDQIEDAPTIYQGIEHVIDEENSKLVVSLLENGDQTSDVPVTDINDLDDVL